ncbi:TauD-domain-containing protein [Lophiostoma macrostomum CBS 122681]|uniref:TauD-domain-containing protein n=1 Tax=Lophiostoma macrostomum CBS 122681 TaxID=1314788 RepID=A0A6A6T7F1_9PLEO|nr:TauD-domain-containing protein [Lophiostoma macrostomum CBS 122681]
MAPALVDTTTETITETRPTYDFANSGTGAYKVAFNTGPKAFQKDNELQGTEKQPPARYPNYLPVWNNETSVYPPLTPFTHYDHGKDADPSFPNLLKDAKVADLTANTGAEVHGVQLTKLTDKGKDELALFVAQKKVVAFRDQDFADLPIQEALDFGGYFGRHHIHPASGAPKGYPEVHLVHRGAEDTTARDFFEERTNSITWHSDVTYEKQPPGTTFLYLLDGPAAGGDTLFANQAAAYRRLSPEFQKRLHGLKAIHSGIEQANNSRERGGVVRRDPVTSIHPLVRTHPATGEKALFVNPQFTRRIVGYKKEESDFLLNFLYDHIAKGQDFQARVKWAPGTVVVWDNRVTAHSALLDWDDGARRHLARITPQAEPPTETPFES